MEPTKNTYMTIPEVASELRLHRRTVITLIRQGKFDGAFRAGREHRIPRASLDCYIASTRAAAPAKPT